jgi:SAM-dependent methyltransferase
MKLSNLINYLTEIDSMSAATIGQKADRELEKITHLTQTHTIQLADFGSRLQQKRDDIQQLFGQFQNDLQLLKTEIVQLIRDTEKFWFQESYRVYEEEMIYETTENILDRRLRISPETEQFFRDRLSKYNSWQHPAMIIRPGAETFINELLASEPMYLVDENYDLLLPTVNLFNEQYQHRLRLYTMDERSGQEILQKLPNTQFGLVFAYHFFNFRPFEIIKKYLIEIHQKLRPGGVLVMTYNDCDREKGVMLAEGRYCCYTPGYLVRELAQSIGFEIVFSWHNDGPSTWIEFRKPGEFVSLRGGQALAQIKPKPIAESK